MSEKDALWGESGPPLHQKVSTLTHVERGTSSNSSCTLFFHPPLLRVTGVLLGMNLLGAVGLLMRPPFSGSTRRKESDH